MNSDRGCYWMRIPDTYTVRLPFGEVDRRTSYTSPVTLRVTADDGHAHVLAWSHIIRIEQWTEPDGIDHLRFRIAGAIVEIAGRRFERLVGEIDGQRLTSLCRGVELDPGEHERTPVAAKHTGYEQAVMTTDPITGEAIVDGVAVDPDAPPPPPRKRVPGKPTKNGVVIDSIVVTEESVDATMKQATEQIQQVLAEDREDRRKLM